MPLVQDDHQEVLTVSVDKVASSGLDIPGESGTALVQDPVLGSHIEFMGIP